MMECNCEDYLRPVYWYNSYNKRWEVDVFVCQKCLREYIAPPNLTHIDILNMDRDKKHDI